MTLGFISTLLACFASVPPQIYWGCVLGIISFGIGYGIYRMDKHNSPFKFWKIFVDQTTGWPIFTNVVLFLVLVFGIWLSMLLSYHEQWKLAVELMEAIITAFVVKFGLASIQSYIQAKFPTAQQIVAEKIVEVAKEGEQK